MGFKTLNEVDFADGTVQLIGCTLLASIHLLCMTDFVVCDNSTLKDLTYT